MTPQQFCYWLHGYFELSKDNKLDEEQFKMVREHLDKVFNREPTQLTYLSDFTPIAQERPQFPLMFSSVCASC